MFSPADAANLPPEMFRDGTLFRKAGDPASFRAGPLSRRGDPPAEWDRGTMSAPCKPVKERAS